MVIGYLRVSTKKQDIDNCKAEILALANDKNLGQVKFVEEVVTGKKSWKIREIAKLMNEMKEGDAIITSEFSRLGRSLLEILEIVSFAFEKKITVYIVKGKWILENNIQSKVVTFAFGLSAEIEGDLISARTKESLATRKAKGLPMGRPKGVGKSKLDKYELEIKALIANGSTQKFIAERYNATEPTLWNWLKKRGLK